MLNNNQLIEIKIRKDLCSDKPRFVWLISYDRQIKYSSVCSGKTFSSMAKAVISALQFLQASTSSEHAFHCN